MSVKLRNQRCVCQREEHLQSTERVLQTALPPEHMQDVEQTLQFVKDERRSHSCISQHLEVFC